MGGRVQVEQLRRAQPQQVLGGLGLGAQRPVHAAGQDGVDLAEAAQHRRHQHADESAVAGFQGFQRRLALEGFFQWQPLPQDALQQQRRRAPRRQARRTRVRALAQLCSRKTPAAGSA